MSLRGTTHKGRPRRSSKLGVDDGLRLNLGCGPVRREGEVGVDREPTAACDVRADLLELPFDDASAVFCRLDHVLEHFPQRMCLRVVLEAFRVLRPGGTIRIGLPDMRATCQAFADEDDLYARLLILRTIYGSQAHPGEFHQSGWDEESLKGLLVSAGFEQVEVGQDSNEDFARTEGINLTATAVKP